VYIRSIRSGNWELGSRGDSILAGLDDGLPIVHRDQGGFLQLPLQGPTHPQKLNEKIDQRSVPIADRRVAKMSTDPSGLWEQLDGLANAEPLSAEDDLILRMSAVSKVRSSKRAKDRKNKAKAGVSPTKGAIRKKEKRKVESMVVDRASTRLTAVAANAAAAVASTNRAELRPRSNSV
jgi:hypothetical protein